MNNPCRSTLQKGKKFLGTSSWIGTEPRLCGTLLPIKTAYGQAGRRLPFSDHPKYGDFSPTSTRHNSYFYCDSRPYLVYHNSSFGVNILKMMIALAMTKD